MCFKYNLCWVLCVGVFVVHSARVQTCQGELDGGWFFTAKGKRVLTYLGVPYAEPPVGEDRFGDPRPMKTWNGVRAAKEFGQLCVQLKTGVNAGDQVQGSEDCLTLNVFIPQRTKFKSLPVLVFFHGGAFMFGGSKFYVPGYLLENHDLVFVSVNYRLGPLGFLSTEDDIVPGNNGLKDQVLALRWVQENIAAFGGDPTRVTIAGSSAGAASVHYHYLSPMSRGLFSRGISASGSALMPWAFTEKPLMKAKMLADAVGCPILLNEAMVQCLKKKPIQQIMTKVKELFMVWQSNPYTPFGPVKERSDRNPFLRENPYRILREGKVFDGPWLVSLTTEEGLYPSSYFIDREELLKSLNHRWKHIAPHLLDFNYTANINQKESVSMQIRNHYFGDKKISPNTVENIIKMVGDRLYNADMGLSVRLQAAAMTSPVYMFEFGYRGSVSMTDNFTKTRRNFGVCHCDDIYYVLNPPGSEILFQKMSDMTVIFAMSNIWADFVKTGHPSPHEGVTWDPVNKDALETEEINYLLVHNAFKMVMTKRSIGDYPFWKSLGLNENENYTSSFSREEDLKLVVKKFCKISKFCKRVLIKLFKR